MNKHRKYVTLIGLLAILLVPTMSHAQPVQAAGQVGSRLGRFFKDNPLSIGERITFAMQAAALESGTSAVQYIPWPAGITVPNLTISSADISELQGIIRQRDLSGITPLHVAKKALVGQDEEHAVQRERWAVWALNHGVNPTEVLFQSVISKTSFLRGPNNLPASALLVDQYGLNPNGTLDDGKPLLVALRDKGPLVEYNLYNLEGIDFNVLLDGEPLIFSTPGSPNGESDFKTLFKKIQKNFWEVLNQQEANPIHVAANSFKLSEVLPKDFQIPEKYLNVQDIHGNTYYHYALQNPQYREENFLWLRQQGANPNIPNKSGDVPTKMLYEKLSSSGKN